LQPVKNKTSILLQIIQLIIIMKNLK